MVFGFPLSDYDCGIKRFRIESRVRLFSLPLPCSARVACHDRLRDSAIRAAAAPVFRAAVPYCVGAGVPDGPLLVPFMPLAGIFRAPARHPFAHGGKRMQKRRQRPMVFGFPLFPCDHAAKRPTRNCLRVPSPLPLPCSARRCAGLSAACWHAVLQNTLRSSVYFAAQRAAPAHAAAGGMCAIW